MSGLLLCGKEAKLPFHIVSADIDIYSIEELAYYLHNNIFMVGKEFFDEELIEFIHTQLEMEGLAGKIKYLTDHRGTFPELMMTIVNASGYYNEEEVEELVNTLRMIGTKSVTERLKVRADLFMEAGKLGRAFEIYKEILTMQRDKTLTNIFYGKVCNNLACIYARRMEYSEAVLYYRKAYELCQDENIVKSIIKIDLLSSNEKDLLEDTLKYKVSDEVLDLVSEELKSYRESVMSQPEYDEICETLVYDGKHNLDDYYEDIHKIIDKWKDEYRNEMV